MPFLWERSRGVVWSNEWQEIAMYVIQTSTVSIFTTLILNLKTSDFNDDK